MMQQIWNLSRKKSKMTKFDIYIKMQPKNTFLWSLRFFPGREKPRNLAKTVENFCCLNFEEFSYLNVFFKNNFTKFNK